MLQPCTDKGYGLFKGQLAMLSQNMLKGKELSAFVQRSLEMMEA